MWRWDQQEPFGVNAPDENPSGLGAFDLPLRLPGQYLDKETNLHYNYFRDYDPTLGRYAEGDPIGLYGGISVYAYAASSPLLLVDLNGLAPGPCDLLKQPPSPNDACNCNRNAIADVCKCYREHPFIFIPGRGVCVERAYLKKSKCIQNCVENACRGSLGTSKG